MSDEQLEELFRFQAEDGRTGRDKFFVNCWHMNEHESAAMWQLYSKGTDAIGIQSRFSTLVDALPPYVNVGLVRYIDYDREVFSKDNSFNAIMHKRTSFAHEAEVRAIAWQSLSAELGGDVIRCDMTASGLPIYVDLQAAVQAVYVHPSAPSWYSETVADL